MFANIHVREIPRSIEAGANPARITHTLTLLSIQIPANRTFLLGLDSRYKIQADTLNWKPRVRKHVAVYGHPLQNEKFDALPEVKKYCPVCRRALPFVWDHCPYDGSDLGIVPGQAEARVAADGRGRVRQDASAFWPFAFEE